jgi:protein HIRA/HIR1
MDVSRLASCGLDNMVIVWQLSATNGAPNPLRGHNGMVKGVSWDPIGKYLATQGDGGEEKAVVIWRVRDWKLEVRNVKPYEKAPDETMFLRLSWSPDGQYLATTNSFLKNENMCVLLARASDTADSPEWNSKVRFKGCRDPVVVASFHPKLLRLNGKLEMCCAIGGSDRALTLWSTHGKRPLLVVNDLFEKQILDITWGGAGYTLALCSIDGTVAILSLQPSEIGHIASAAETNAELRSLYGDGFNQSGQGGGFGDMHLPEDAVQLGFEAKKKQAQNGAHANGVPRCTSGSHAAVARDVQQEVKTDTGKRRILPKVILVFDV